MRGWCSSCFGENNINHRGDTPRPGPHHGTTSHSWALQSLCLQPTVLGFWLVPRQMCSSLGPACQCQAERCRPRECEVPPWVRRSKESGPSCSLPWYQGPQSLVPRSISGTTSILLNAHPAIWGQDPILQAARLVSCWFLPSSDIWARSSSCRICGQCLASYSWADLVSDACPALWPIFALTIGASAGSLAILHCPPPGGALYKGLLCGVSPLGERRPVSAGHSTTLLNKRTPLGPQHCPVSEMPFYLKRLESGEKEMNIIRDFYQNKMLSTIWLLEMLYNLWTIYI